MRPLRHCNILLDYEDSVYFRLKIEPLILYRDFYLFGLFGHHPTLPVIYLSRGTADEEPLVNGGVNLLRSKLLVSRQRWKGALVNAGRGVLDSGVGPNAMLVSCDKRTAWFPWENSRRDTAGGSLASDQAIPGLTALADNVHGVA